ncbi:MAG: hypothetical protein ACP5T3_03160 [Candidatus Micrarchaeia archaeon]
MRTTQTIRKPNVQFWNKVMLLHAPWISRYALHKLDKWYFEDEPKLFEMQRAMKIAEAEKARNAMTGNASNASAAYDK